MRPGITSELIYCLTENIWLCPGRCHRKWHFRQYKKEIEFTVGMIGNAKDKGSDGVDTRAYSSRQSKRKS